MNGFAQNQVAVCPATARGTRSAFTLIELLVVLAIIALLAALLLPSLAEGKLKAKVVKAKSDLQQIGLALEMYAADHEGAVPPVRVNCNSDLVLHWCQLPVELADEGYLPRGHDGGLEADFRDVFNPGFTYKYGAPGPEYLNGSLSGNYQLWVPNSFPAANTNDTGKYYSDPKKSPVRWVVWSMGPKPNSGRSQHSHAPMSAETWHGRRGKDGVIVRYATPDGTQYISE